MGSSTKKKREKKKDFQKTKLKIGKTKAKAANVTDTSFTTKRIIIRNQSISTAAPSATAQFSHHLSLLRSKSDSQRSESLAHLASAYTARPADSTPPEATATLLPKLQPLMLDSSGAVRQQLLKLMRCLPSADIARRPEQIMLHTHAAMTHLSVDIRLFSMDVLDWLLEIAGNEIVRCTGGWVKTLRRFIAVLGWEQFDEIKDGWSSIKVNNTRIGRDGKLMSRQLSTLAMFIKVGLRSPSKEAINAAKAQKIGAFPYWHVDEHGLPHRSNTFARLNLFGAPRNDDNQIYEDRQDRQIVFQKFFLVPIRTGTQLIQKEGGEVGRAAASINRAIDDGMIDFPT